MEMASGRINDIIIIDRTIIKITIITFWWTLELRSCQWTEFQAGRRDPRQRAFKYDMLCVVRGGAGERTTHGEDRQPNGDRGKDAQSRGDTRVVPLWAALRAASQPTFTPRKHRVPFRQALTHHDVLFNAPTSAQLSNDLRAPTTHNSRYRPWRRQVCRLRLSPVAKPHLPWPRRASCVSWLLSRR